MNHGSDRVVSALGGGVDKCVQARSTLSLNGRNENGVARPSSVPEPTKGNSGLASLRLLPHPCHPGRNGSRRRRFSDLLLRANGASMGLWETTREFHRALSQTRGSMRKSSGWSACASRHCASATARYSARTPAACTGSTWNSLVVAH